MGVRVSVILAVSMGLLAGVFYVEYQKRAGEFDLELVSKIPERSMVYDAYGQVFSFIQGENRFLIPLDKVPVDFINALLAREDVRFWQHNGIDTIGIARAAMANFQRGAVRQGGSTITQQLARNTYALKARTLDRKLLEAFLAGRIERRYSKREIMEYYVNRVYFGAGAYGLQRAAQVYFGKPAESLSLSECAVLVGLIRSPNRYSPISNPKGAREQRDGVLERMEFLGMITPEVTATAKAEPMKVTGQRFLPSGQGYAMDAVRRDLELILTEEQVEMGGLKIFTTIDPVLQALGEKVVGQRLKEVEQRSGWHHPRKSAYVPAPEGQKEKPTPYLQGALLAVDNRSGAIRAIVGGRDYAQSKYDRACMSKRQVGSTFKPFVYATAFQRGLAPGTWIDDSPIAPGEFPDIPKNWSPKNSNNEYQGLQPAALGLIRSRNTMSVRVGEFASLREVSRMAKQAGLEIMPYPSSFLGGFEASLRDLTSAYTVFPNLGERAPSFLIARIEDASGRVIFEVPRSRFRVLTRGSAGVTSELLQYVMTMGTAAKSAKMGLTKPAAGKTGTSNDYKDAWFVGYTSSLTCGVWVGFDKPQPIMAKGYGGTLALPIWVDFIQGISAKNYPALALDKEGSRQRVALCSQSNRLATEACQRAMTAYFTELPPEMTPHDACPLHHDMAPSYAYGAGGPAMAMPPGQMQPRVGNGGIGQQYGVNGGGGPYGAGGGMMMPPTAQQPPPPDPQAGYLPRSRAMMGGEAEAAQREQQFAEAQAQAQARAEAGQRDHRNNSRVRMEAGVPVMRAIPVR